MNYRRLCPGGPEVSEISLGCWQFGGDFGPMSDETANRIMSEAVSHNVNFFDTADVYGNGRSETLIGQFFEKKNTRIFIATKFGRAASVYPDKYSEETLRKSVEHSLTRLKTEVIDLIQLHCIPKEYMADGAVFEWLGKLKQEGKILHFGASVETVEEALLCLKVDGITALQIIFNIFRQKPIETLFSKSRQAGVGLIIRLPLASGLLSGKFTRSTQFAESDHRNYNRDGQMFNVGETFAGLPFEKGIELSRSLQALVPADMTMTQMALRWILDHEEVSVVIPGASSEQQVIENTKASTLPSLSKELHQRIRDFYKNEVHEHIRGPY